MLRGTLSPVLEPLYAPRMRPERLIAAGRVVLAVSSLFAVWLDPDEPIRYATVAYGVLLAYVLYAIAVATLLWRVEAVPRLWPMITHAADLACFSLFIFFTDPTSRSRCISSSRCWPRRCGGRCEARCGRRRS